MAEGVSRAGVRRRHRRAARGHLRRRARRRKASSRSARSIRPSCSAATTRSCTTWRSRTCRSASPSTAPGWSAPTARPMPAPSTSPTSPACRTWSVMAAADEAELVHMVATAVAHDRGPIALRYPRGDGVGVDMPERGESAADRQGPGGARGLADRDPDARDAARRGAEGGRGTRGAWACRPRSPTRASPSPSTAS